jgi:hypothetical protein
LPVAPARAALTNSKDVPLFGIDNPTDCRFEESFQAEP